MDAELDDVSWAAMLGPFRALRHSFAVRTTDPGLARYLDGVLGALGTDTEPGVLYSFIDRGEAAEGRYIVYADREPLTYASRSGPYMLETLLWHINRRAVESSADLVTLHAGAVVRDGRALLLPARAGWGKSTLVAGLVRAGLGYLTDEAAAINPDALEVQPYPKPIALGMGSKEVLADLVPVLDADIANRYSGDEWHLDPRAIRSDSVAPASPPALVIAPRYERGATSELTGMSRAEALVMLSEHAFNLRGRSSFDTLAAVARRCECYRLVVGNLDEACELILELPSFGVIAPT